MWTTSDFLVLGCWFLGLCVYLAWAYASHRMDLRDKKREREAKHMTQRINDIERYANAAKRDRRTHGRAEAGV